MTSNIGSEVIIKQELSQEQKLNQVDDILKSRFKPEFLNRIDETIHFNNLAEDRIAEIVEIQLEEVVTRIKTKGFDIKFSAEAKNLIAKKGYDPIYGARPIKRTIQREVLNPLAKLLIANKFEADKLIKVNVKDSMIVFD